MTVGADEASPDLVVIGRVGGAHGVHGGLRIFSATQPKDNILRYRPWWLGKGEHYRPVVLSSLEPHGDAFLAKLEGVDDRDAALALRGAEVAVPRSVLPALEAGEEYYWRDLIGLAVVNADAEMLGTVRELMETGAHDVLVVQPAGAGKRQLLIPFVAAFVTAVDLAAGEIRVDWLEPA